MTKLTGQNVHAGHDGAQCITRATSLGTRLLRRLNTSAFRGCSKRRTFDEILKKLGSLTLFKSDWRNLSEPHLPTTQLSGFKCILGDVWGKVTAENALLLGGNLPPDIT